MEKDERSCTCGRPLGPRRRKYCAPCARKVARFARIRWKHVARRRSTDEYRSYRLEQNLGRGDDDPRGTVPYWLEAWTKKTRNGETPREAYNAFMRRYMRAYRAGLRARAS